MFKLTDRLLTFSYVKSYVICLVSLLGLYIVVDLFNNIDDFTQVKGGLVPTMHHVWDYYSTNTTLIFDRLSEAIVLLAAMFTIAWMQRNNELLPLLSAGVSTRRVVRPVLIAAFLMMFVNVANQELLLPYAGSVQRGDPNYQKELQVEGAFDSNEVFLTGNKAVKATYTVEYMTVVIPPEIAPGMIITLTAEKATYVPDENRPRTGGWLLENVVPAELPVTTWSRTDVLQPMDPGKYFLYTTNLDFERLTENRGWFRQDSTWELLHMLNTSDSNKLASIAVMFHTRLTRPLLGMILVVMGLSVILRDQNRNIFISAGFCLGICALFFLVGMLAKYLGDNEFLSPALAAWLPVLIFGPMAFVLFDAIHT